MTTDNQKKYFDNSLLDEVLKDIYGDVSDDLKLRLNSLAHAFKNSFPDYKKGYVFSSPGRIEICGNHTDHNNGKVMAAAVSVDILAVATPSDDSLVSVDSDGYPRMTVDLNDIAFKEKNKGTSFALIQGVADYFVSHGYKVGGFKACFTSRVPKGAGVSSSSAFEVLVGEIFNRFYNDGKVSAIEKAKASQYAENRYFGKPCGLMDQAAIALGGVNLIDFKDTQNPDVIPAPWNDNTLDIFVINAGGDHSDLVDDYAGILNDMKSVAKFFSVDSLRSTSKSEVLKYAQTLSQKVSGRAVLRALHFFEECDRVDAALKAIRDGDTKAFLNVINESGDSSWRLLQNLYPPSDTAQYLPFAITYAKESGLCEAVRVHGGGFAGTILAFVKKENSDKFKKLMADMFGDDRVFKLVVRGSGATLVTEVNL